MEISSMAVLLLALLSFSLLQTSHSTTILLDGISEWRNPTVHVRDTIIFSHKYHYKLYIFRNEKAFNLCNLTEATILSQPNSTSFTWYPSRLGFFYFTFVNGSLNTCQHSQKLDVKVLPAAAAPPENGVPELRPNAAPKPAPGGIVSSSPAFPWPKIPTESVSPAQPPMESSPVPVSSLVPGKGGKIPFINSNPAVPLPTGEVDSATIRPLPTSGHGGKVVPGFQKLISVALLLLL